jgi:nucleotide-binding universal stress UspA family protein
MDTLLSTAPLDDLKVRTHLSRGKPSDRIADLAESLDVDVIVMGTIGRSGLRGLLIGNTAEAVLERVARPVLAVKPLGFVSPLDAPDGDTPVFETVGSSELLAPTG